MQIRWITSPTYIRWKEKASPTGLEITIRIARFRGQKENSKQKGILEKRRFNNEVWHVSCAKQKRRFSSIADQSIVLFTVFSIFFFLSFPFANYHRNQIQEIKKHLKMDLFDSHIQLEAPKKNKTRNPKTSKRIKERKHEMWNALSRIFHL